MPKKPATPTGAQQNAAMFSAEDGYNNNNSSSSSNQGRIPSLSKNEKQNTYNAVDNYRSTVALTTEVPLDIRTTELDEFNERIKTEPVDRKPRDNLERLHHIHELFLRGRTDLP